MKMSKEKRKQIEAKTDGRCAYCGDIYRFDGEHQVDHMIPRIQGGSSKVKNLVLACRKCNNLKKGRTVEQFRYYIIGGIRKYIEQAEKHLELYNQYISDDARGLVMEELAIIDKNIDRLARSGAASFYFDDIEVSE